MKAHLTALAACLLAAPAHAGWDEFQAGWTDRGIWETWFDSTGGPYHDGANFWAGQRSLPHPTSCESTVETFTHGCRDAQVRLYPSDQRRKTEPDYKRGWNEWQPAPPSRPGAPDLSGGRPPVSAYTAPALSSSISSFVPRDPSETVTHTQLIFNDKSYVTEVVLNDAVRARVMLDTGATTMCLNQAVLDRLIELHSVVGADYLGEGRSRLADGSVTTDSRWQIDSISAFGVKFNHVAVTSCGHGMSLLGLNLLRRIKSWSIDSETSVFTAYITGLR
jgi:hypothetical protein